MDGRCVCERGKRERECVSKRWMEGVCVRERKEREREWEREKEYRKYIKLNFLIKDQKFHALSQNRNSVNAKNTNASFFRVGGSKF